VHLDVNLSGAYLDQADLNGVDLSYVNLRFTDLSEANLSEANLHYARLNGELLDGTQVRKAKFTYVDLTDAFYAPVSEPPDPYVAGIRGLSTLHVPSGKQTGLVQLRKLLQEGGFRDAERAATYAIERSTTTERFRSAPMFLQKLLAGFGFIDGAQIGLAQAREDPLERFDLELHRVFDPSYGRGDSTGSGDSTGAFEWIEGLLRLAGFDMTTAYGLHPTRALLMIVVLGGILTLVYMWPIRCAPKHPGKASGIYQVFPADRIDETSAEPTAEKELKVIRVQENNWVNAFGAAAYFSLLSAVNIGFEQFAVGDWIRRLQDRDYSLEAVGWVRVVAGTQALLSVYLLAMWVLTQYGRPFE
jgi:hypothetical protein